MALLCKAVFVCVQSLSAQRFLTNGFQNTFFRIGSKYLLFEKNCGIIELLKITEK